MTGVALSALSSLRHSIGLLLAVLCTIAPALPWGGLFAQPPIPMAALWAAYGWAADGQGGWRAPAAVVGLGLLQDLAAGGPLGFYAFMFLGAYVIAGFAANAMRSANLLSPWTGFAVTAAGAGVLAALLARVTIGADTGLGPFVAVLGVTALLFPLVRPLYMDQGFSAGGRR